MAETYAIIEESGGQRKVAQGDEILVDLYNGGEAKAGDTITIDKVLVAGTPGGDAAIGNVDVGGLVQTGGGVQHPGAADGQARHGAAPPGSA